MTAATRLVAHWPGQQRMGSVSSDAPGTPVKEPKTEQYVTSLRHLAMAQAGRRLALAVMIHCMPTFTKHARAPMWLTEPPVKSSRGSCSDWGALKQMTQNACTETSALSGFERCENMRCLSAPMPQAPHLTSCRTWKTKHSDKSCLPPRCASWRPCFRNGPTALILLRLNQ